MKSGTGTTLGQVVTTGVELMRVVPTGSTLDVEAYLPNADVGFVQGLDRQTILNQVEVISIEFQRELRHKGTDPNLRCVAVLGGTNSMVDNQTR